MRKAGDVLYVDIFSDNQGRSKGCGLVEYATEEDAQRAIKELSGTNLDGRDLFIRQDDSNQAKFDKDNNQKPRETREPREPREPRDREQGREPYRGGNSRGGRGGFRSDNRQDDRSDNRSGNRSDYRSDYRSDNRPNYKSDRRPDNRSENRPDNRSDNRPPVSRSNEDQSDKPGFDSRTNGWQLIIKNLSWGVTWFQLKSEFKQFGNVIRADVPQDQSGRSLGYGFVIFENQADADQAIKAMDDTDFNGRNITVKYSASK